MAAGLLLHGIGGPRGAWGRSPDEERLLSEVFWENIVNHFEGFLLAVTSAGERSGMSVSEQLRFSWLEYGVLVTCG